jgi:N-acetylneuraminate synthase
VKIIVPQPPYIIAEVGACHDGSLETALDLIEIASEFGCHAIKFQLYDAQRLSRNRHAEAFYETYLKYQLPLAWLPTLKLEAKKWDLDFILSVYDASDLQEAVAYADWLKVSSFESGDLALLEACAATHKNLVISTGMCDVVDMGKLWRFREDSVTQVALLHCISAYPAPARDLNLSAIHRDQLDGYSDHSGNRIAGGIAVAYGAKILEVHIRDTDTPEDNPDFKHALGPSALAAYVTAAVDAQVMGGHGRREIMPSERGNVQYKVKG